MSPLLPLLANKTCTFTMKTAPWAMPWLPSLDIHFQDKQSQGIFQEGMFLVASESVVNGIVKVWLGKLTVLA